MQKRIEIKDATCSASSYWIAGTYPCNKAFDLEYGYGPTWYSAYGDNFGTWISIVFPRYALLVRNSI